MGQAWARLSHMSGRSVEKICRKMKRSYTGRMSHRAALSISPRVESDGSKLPKGISAAAFPAYAPFPGDPTGGKARVRQGRMGMDITWVTDRIAVGGGIWTAENMAAVSRTGITHILDMQIEFDDTALAEPHGIAVCWNPIDDDFEPKPPEVFERGVEFALAALEEDRTKLFVHCAAGVHRAPMMELALLSVMGWSLEDAADLIEARRPAADFADVYVRSVEEFLKGRG
jgi:protein-tyrosine phosphatase